MGANKVQQVLKTQVPETSGDAAGSADALQKFGKQIEREFLDAAEWRSAVSMAVVGYVIVDRDEFDEVVGGKVRDATRMNSQGLSYYSKTDQVMLDVGVKTVGFYLRFETEGQKPKFLKMSNYFPDAKCLGGSQEKFDQVAQNLLFRLDNLF